LIPKTAEARGRILKSAVFWRLLFRKDSRKKPHQIDILKLLNCKIGIKKEYSKNQNPVRNPDPNHHRNQDSQQNHFRIAPWSRPNRRIFKNPYLKRIDTGNFPNRVQNPQIVGNLTQRLARPNIHAAKPDLFVVSPQFRSLVILSAFVNKK
jgi:hypothetical protein